jgi:hypothetical protein
MAMELERRIRFSVLITSMVVGFLMIVSAANSQTPTSGQQAVASTKAEPNRTVTNTAVATPVFGAYKGVTLGMTAIEVRQRLDHPKEEGKLQDFFALSDSEMAQVFYDGDGKVTAISIDYLGEKAAPSMKEILGEEPQPKADGSVYQLRRYPEAGYWVAYNRTAGDKPIITVTMQKLP